MAKRPDETKGAQNRFADAQQGTVFCPTRVLRGNPISQARLGSFIITFFGHVDFYS